MRWKSQPKSREWKPEHVRKAGHDARFPACLQGREWSAEHTTSADAALGPAAKDKAVQGRLAVIVPQKESIPLGTFSRQRFSLPCQSRFRIMKREGRGRRIRIGSISCLPVMNSPQPLPQKLPIRTDYVNFGL